METALENWVREGLPDSMFVYPGFIRTDVRALLYAIETHVRSRSSE